MDQTTEHEPTDATPHRTFDLELEALEAAVLAQADRVVAILGATAERLGSTNVDADAVDAEDDAVDEAYAAIEHDAILLIARRQPVARDLRRILALLHSSLHLERIADGAVDIAGFLAIDGAVPTPMLDLLREMVATAVTMTETAMRALVTQDTELALRVEEIDDELDRSQTTVFELITAQPVDGDALPTMLTADRTARALERAGDHAVDIAEEAWFLATGESREFGRPRSAR